MADWSREEVALIVSDYFSMLMSELKGEPYSKAEHRRKLMPLLNNRSEGSIEFKHQNISAVLKEIGLPFIKGYKYRENYQQILFDEVEAYLYNHEQLLLPYFEDFSTRAVKMPALKEVGFDKFEAPPPESLESEKCIRTPRFIPRMINYLEREQNNRALGEKGERLVIEYERERLARAGEVGLAAEIKWISKEKGDGAGYDILSKNVDGSDRFIEVKTTKLTKETPIFVTKNEIEFAKLKKDSFFLYRVYDAEYSPGFFFKRGEYQTFCKLDAQVFKGLF